MAKRTKFPIGIRLFAGFLALILLTSVIVFVAIARLSDLNSILSQLQKRELAEVHTLWKVRTLITGMESNLRNILLNHEQRKHLLQMWEKRQAVGESLATFDKLNPHPSDEEERLFGELTTRYRSFDASTADIVILARQGQETQASGLPLGTWEELQQATLESLERLFDYEDREAEQRVTLAQAKSLSARGTIITLAAVGALLSLALAVGITFSLTRPITRLIEATERVSQGDLTSKAEIVSEDEIGVLARRFNEMLDRLNRFISDQRRFYADASHELRTPLTIIRGESEVALRGPDNSVQGYRKVLESIITVTSEMGRLIDELLFLARSEAGQIEYEVAKVALVPLLADIARQSEDLAALKGVCLDLDVRGTMVVWGDLHHLRQLFFILTDNAIKYTETGGQVTLALEAEAEGAKVMVSDTGIGIPEEELPYVFERFYRGDTAKVMREEGTGLGLSIAESIVKAHKGKIFINSVLGRGTTVSVTLPRNTPWE